MKKLLPFVLLAVAGFALFRCAPVQAPQNPVGVEVVPMNAERAPVIAEEAPEILVEPPVDATEVEARRDTTTNELEQTSEIPEHRIFSRAGPTVKKVRKGID
jgi:hypothetical protein